MPAPAVPGPVALVRVPALALVQALVDHPVPVALAALLVPAALRPQAKLRARSVPLPAEDAEDARSIPRPKKAP
jgi:hypothetical protein